MATLRATQSFHADGRFIADGDELDAKDPIVEGREVLFEQVEDVPAKKAPAKKAPAAKKRA